MIGIIGASGFIGYNLYKALKSSRRKVIGTYFLNKKKELARFDLKRGDFSLFDKCAQVVISSAITNIDECFLNKDEAYRINVKKTIEFIQYLADRAIKPIFLSSDQVFDGKKGNYTEKDEPHPINFYGDFKLQVEEFMKKNVENYLILRLSKIYSRDLNEPGMFTEMFLRLKKKEKIKAAYNQIFNPTDVNMAGYAINKALNKNLKNLYHLANSAVMSRYDFALSIAKEYGFDKNLIIPVDIRILPFLEKRPLNTSLNVERIAGEIFPLRKMTAKSRE